MRAGRDTSGVTFPLLATRLAVIRGQVMGVDARASTRRRIPRSDPWRRDELLRAISGGEGVGVPHVAVVRASGAISMASSGSPFGGSEGIAESDLGAMLHDLTGDESVKAVVLCIDSPGGSALASDLLWKRLMDLRAKKPLVVSVGSYAASGGYYMACAGTKIFAEATSIVGSIGVVGGKFAVGKTLEQVGIHVETITANEDPNLAAALRERLGELGQLWQVQSVDLGVRVGRHARVADVPKGRHRRLEAAGHGAEVIVGGLQAAERHRQAVGAAQHQIRRQAGGHLGESGQIGSGLNGRRGLGQVARRLGRGHGGHGRNQPLGDRLADQQRQQVDVLRAQALLLGARGLRAGRQRFGQAHVERRRGAVVKAQLLSLIHI